jgi:NAD(P)-dependent dehydrogenase (short-subunit alcohol dehydrogenase family)
VTSSKTFLVAGVGGGLGRAFAEQALRVGHRVVGTVHRPEQVAEFEALEPGRAFARVLDIGSATGIEPVVRWIEDDIAPIDVLVVGTDRGRDESAVDDPRAQFDIDVFGTVAVVKAVLPGMRRRRGGLVVVVTPGATPRSHHGGKFALVGIMLSLATEVAPFGVRVTAVDPEGLRAAWSSGSRLLEQADLPLALGAGAAEAASDPLSP